MKTRFWEMTTAAALVLLLVAGVMSVVVFAREEETPDDTAQTAEAYVTVDLSARTPLSTMAAQGAEAAATPVTDNRTSVPLYAGDAESGVCEIMGGTPLVSAEVFCRALGMSVSGSYNDSVYALYCDGLELRAEEGASYFSCNDRYFYVADGVRLIDGQAYLPVAELAGCFGVTAVWDRVLWRVELTGEASAPEDGGGYYDETDVYWLSRVISAEAGNQTLEGQLAVGNVVLERVADEAFGDTIYDVIFEKNQFDVVINGMIYMEPTEDALIAAKLALEGYTVVPGALYFATTYLGGDYECVAWIGDHCFMA